MATKSELPQEIQDKWELPQKWADCTDEQKDMVTTMNFHFSNLSGLTEPATWSTKIKMWCDPMIHIMNATGWTDAGLRRGVRVVRKTIAEMVHDRVEISSVKTIQKRTCNLLGSEQFIRTDFPELSYEEFTAKMQKQLYQETTQTELDTLSNQAALFARAEKTVNQYPGDTLADKLDAMARHLYGESNE